MERKCICSNGLGYVFLGKTYSPTYSSNFLFQIYLNYLANYVPNAWTYERGCTICDQDMLDLAQLTVSKPKSQILLKTALIISIFCTFICKSVYITLRVIQGCGAFLKSTRTVITSNNNNNSVWRIESRNRKLCVTVGREMAFWFLQRVYLNGCHPALGHFIVA